jgi:hypothetical protein
VHLAGPFFQPEGGPALFADNKDIEENMDLKTYYSNIRAVETTLEGENIVVISLATSEGGKAGVATEVQRYVAAKLIADQRARVATREEAEVFYLESEKRRLRFEQEEEARRMRVMVIPSADLRKGKDRS